MEYNITFAVWGYYDIEFDTESFDSSGEMEKEILNYISEVNCGDLYDIDSDVISEDYYETKYELRVEYKGYCDIELNADSYEEAEEKAMSLITEIDCGDLYDIDSEIVNSRVNEKEIE